MKLIGLDGEYRREVYSKLFESMKNLNINMNLFEHNYNEIIGILDYCYKWIDSQQFDEKKIKQALHYLKNSDKHQSDVELIRSNLENKLEELDINIISTPNYGKKKYPYTIDEDNLKSTIISSYKHNSHNETELNEDMIENDVKSISAMYRLRGSSNPKSINQAKYLFVTDNNSLAFASFKFRKSSNISVCVTDEYLGTIIWLNSNLDYSKIQSLKIIADSYSSIQPNIELVNKYLSEINKLKENGSAQRNI